MEEDKNQAADSSEEEFDENYESGDLVKCRFYRNRVPQKDEIVMVQTTELRDMGANVILLEYDNLEGFIMLSHVSSRRVRSVAKFLKIGRKEMMEVMRVDEEKMCIDLSKKTLKADAVDEAHKRYISSKKVHAIMKQTAVKLKIPVLQLYEQWGWDLYDIGFEHAHDAFRIALADPEQVFSKIDIPPEHQTVLLETIKRKMTVNPLKIRVDFSLTCTSYDGIEVIREAMLTARHEVNDANWNVEFKMIAPPIYKCEVVTHSRNEGEAKLKQALAIIRRVMKENGGSFKQKSEPTIIGDKGLDEPDLAELLDNFKARQDE